MAIHGADDWILVTGVSRDKKADEIVGALAPSFDTIICTAAHHKGADAQEHRRRSRARQSRSGYSCRRDDRGRGPHRAGIGQGEPAKIYVAGGLFLAIEYATVAKGGRAEDLKFF